jgi:serine/threonine protein kinase
VKTNGKRACEVCGTALNENSEFCPVCSLRGAVSPETEAISEISSELHFEHYQVLKNEDGTPMELGRGGMGVTYKAIDTHLRCPVALKIISAQFIGNEAARSRFLREARAAASVRHSNVASVFHLGESGGNYSYAMEFVDGETLEALLRRRGRLETDLALEILTQVAAGLTAIHKQHLVHRDIKPSNIMLSWEEGRLENVKIIDLGLAKGVTEDTLSIAGSFIGTPTYASPEQFAGLGTDIRSDLYSLGITLWEMLSGKPPFQGSAAELMDQHQRAAPPTERLKNLLPPVIALLQVLLAKDPSQRFQNPAQLQKAITKVRGAIGSKLGLTADELRSVNAEVTASTSKRKPRRQSVRWVLAAGLCFAGALIAWFFFFGHAGFLSNQRLTGAVPTEKSIAVLPFENISANKDDAYFADGVQDEILNNLAKIAQLKVISRTSVMQYRADSKRDLRQIANALGVANVLEGTVRRDGNHVRVSTELVDARNDNTIWADSYDRDLTDIFAIQSEVAQTIATKLTATLSPQEKQSIEAKLTENLEAYDLYLRAKELIDYADLNPLLTGYEKPLRDAINLLDQAVQLDPKFTLAYCAEAYVHDGLYRAYDPTPNRRSLGDTAVNNALRLQPDLPEVHYAYAHHLYVSYRDYERARVQLAMARRGMPNNTAAMVLAAFMDRRQGDFEKAIQELKAAIILDPRNPMTELPNSLSMARQFSAAAEAYDRAIDLAPDYPILKLIKAYWVTFLKTGDDTALRSALAALSVSMAEDRDVVTWGLDCALLDRDWHQALGLVDELKGGDDDGGFGYMQVPVPAGCYLILIARMQGQQPNNNSSFAETREQLNQRVQESQADGKARLLSNLAVVDALLGKKQDATAEGKRAVDMLPISKDAMDGASVLINLAVVYAWTGEPDLAFETLSSLTKTPNGIYYGYLKREPYWDPLRKDPRFEKLLAELAPKD